MGWLWYRRLGHVGMKQLNKLAKHDLVRGLKDVTFEKNGYVVHVKLESKWAILIQRRVQ
jgi:hypothetical protein